MTELPDLIEWWPEWIWGGEATAAGPHQRSFDMLISFWFIKITERCCRQPFMWNAHLFHIFIFIFCFIFVLADKRKVIDHEAVSKPLHKLYSIEYTTVHMKGEKQENCGIFFYCIFQLFTITLFYFLSEGKGNDPIRRKSFHLIPQQVPEVCLISGSLPAPPPPSWLFPFSHLHYRQLCFISADFTIRIQTLIMGLLRYMQLHQSLS